MFLSINTSAFDKIGDIKIILAQLKKAGFDAYDYSMADDEYRSNPSVLFYTDWKERAQELRKYADEIGIVCNQSHAPFPIRLEGNDEYNKKTFTEIIRCIEITGILGGKICVIHPDINATAEENAEFYNSLLPYAKRYNVKIGLENTYWLSGETAIPVACSHHKDFLRHLELLDKEWFVANVDIGHAEMQGLDTSMEEMLYTLKDRVQALHIHDNDKKHDCHGIPFTVKIDFEKVCKILKEVAYEGDITFEVDLSSMPLELLETTMSFMATLAAYMRDVIGNKRIIGF